MNIQEFRKKYPEYNDISDQQLSDSLHKKFYSDMDRAEFDRRFLGVQTQPQRGLLEQMGRMTTRQLPLAGMMFGGAGGALLGAPAGGIGAIPGGVAGGALGAGMGRSAQEIIESRMGWKEPEPLPELYYDIGLEMGKGAMAEMGGGIAGKALGTIFGGAKKIAPNVRQLFREGFPVTRGTVVEKAAQKIPPGSWWFKRWGRKLNEMVKGANEQFQRERLTLPPTTTPKPSAEETQAAWQAWLDDVGGKNAMIDAPNINTWFKEYGSRMNQIRQANKGLAESLDRINTQINKTGQAKLGDINESFKGLWASWKKLNRREFGAAKSAIGKFKESAVNDFMAIEQSTGQPIYSRYLEADELQRLGYSIDKAKFIESLFDKSSTYIEETGEYVFQPVKFKVQVQSNYQKILEKFGKNSEVPELLMEYANKMEGAARDLATYTRASKTKWFEEMGGATLTGGPIYGTAYAAAGPVGVTVPVGFNTIMAHSLAHPRGYMKRFLFRETPGAFMGRMGKEATKIGIMWQPEEKQQIIRMPIQE